LNKVQREPYLFLANFPEDGYGLCCFCKYAEWSGYSPCDSSLDCKHPLNVINGLLDDGDHSNAVWGDGADCWGFRPKYSLEYIGKFASIRAEGNVPHWSNKFKELVAIIPSARDRQELLI
jgi:hypothetical protein